MKLTIRSLLQIGMKKIALFLIALYRFIGAPFFGGNCRFHPSCSEYGRQAFLTHPPLTAFKLTVRRLGQCHPWGRYGEDPVPPSTEQIS